MLFNMNVKSLHMKRSEGSGELSSLPLAPPQRAVPSLHPSVSLTIPLPPIPFHVLHTRQWRGFLLGMTLFPVTKQQIKSKHKKQGLKIFRLKEQPEKLRWREKMHFLIILCRGQCYEKETLRNSTICAISQLMILLLSSCKYLVEKNA